MEIYGHRGAKGVAMENSLQGFQLAASQGIDRFELDLRLSADNQLMVVHDENLERLASTSIRVSRSNAATLEKTCLKGIDQGIPTLEQVINACPHVAHWQFEIKTHSTNTMFVKQISKIIDQYKLNGKVAVTSKHVGILNAFKHAHPEIDRGYVQEWPLPHGIRTALKLKCKFLCLNKSLVRNSYVKKAQKKGLHVSVWTVNDGDDMKRFYRYGVDSIISDYPQAAREITHQLKQSTNGSL